VVGFWILVVLLVALLAVLPFWPYSRTWGRGPLLVAIAAVGIWIVAILLGWVVFALPIGADQVPAEQVSPVE